MTSSWQAEKGNKENNMTGEFNTAPPTTRSASALEVAQAAAVLIGTLGGTPAVGAPTSHNVYASLYANTNGGDPNQGLVVLADESMASGESSKPQRRGRGKVITALAAVLTLAVVGGGVYAYNNPSIFALRADKAKDKPVPDIDPYNVLPIEVMQGVNHYAPVTIRMVETGVVSVPVKYNYHATKEEIAKLTKEAKKGEAVLVGGVKTFNLEKDANGVPLYASIRTSVEGIPYFVGKDGQKPFTFTKTPKGYDIVVDPSLWNIKAQLDMKDGNVWPDDQESFTYPRLPANPLPDGEHDLVDGEADRVFNLLKDKGSSKNVMNDPLAAGVFYQLSAGSLANLEEGKTANQGKAAIDAAEKQSMTFFMKEAGKAVGVDFTVSFKSGTFNSNFLTDLAEAHPAAYKIATETKLFSTTAQTTVSVEPTYDEQGLRIGRK